MAVLTLQQDLDTLQTWEYLWDMDFYPNKCQVLHITKFRHPAQHVYMLHRQALESVGHAKYLGCGIWLYQFLIIAYLFTLDISKDLSWNTHINRITANAKRTLHVGFLKRNIKTQYTDICTAAYSTLVRPQVEYPLLYAIVTQMQNNLGWRTPEDHRAVARHILFYKIVYGLVAVTLPACILQPNRLTRHMHPLHFIQIPTTASYYKYSFFPLAMVQRNQLPHHIPVLSDLDSFRSGVMTLSHCMPLTTTLVFICF